MAAAAWSSTGIAGEQAIVASLAVPSGSAPIPPSRVSSPTNPMIVADVRVAGGLPAAEQVVAGEALEEVAAAVADDDVVAAAALDVLDVRAGVVGLSGRAVVGHSVEAHRDRAVGRAEVERCRAPAPPV